ncbi:MAG: hypothetical protein QOF89_1393 [Acidobacteriota bacterium]|jgi:hypothetical protein|nr:hypothetical protein [Acidobacteriota bacterium]
MTHRRRDPWILALMAIFAPIAVTCSPADPAPGVLAASPTAQHELGSAPVTVEVPLPPDASQRIASLPQGKHLRLVIEGLKQVQPGAIYEVYLNLPEGQRPDPNGPHHLGNLALYTDPESTPEISRGFDITDAVKALRGRGQWKGPVRLTFVRERLGSPPATTEGAEPGAFYRFKRVSIVER